MRNYVWYMAYGMIYIYMRNYTWYTESIYILEHIYIYIQYIYVCVKWYDS